MKALVLLLRVFSRGHVWEFSPLRNDFISSLTSIVPHR